MHLQTQNKIPNAVVFFARDFLAKEFSELAKYFDDYNRIYITANKHEESLIRSNDEQAVIFSLLDLPRWNKVVIHTSTIGVAFNNDRYLRAYNQNSIGNICKIVTGICDFITKNYNVIYYFDEPVSGYPNWYFNRVLSAAGAQCLHFQTTWLPGFMFFTEDAAQLKPVILNLSINCIDLVTKHIQNRSLGLSRPTYVINYSGITKRITDYFLTATKAIYRSAFRKTALYINRDTTAHWYHAQCLLKSFLTTYSKSPAPGSALRFVLVPLHYEPEAVLNYFSSYTRQEEIAAQILDTLPLGFCLILKEHPSQPGALGHSKWRSLVRSSRVISLRGDFNSNYLLALDVIVVSIGSTLALEAAIAKRPVGVLGQVHYAEMPGVRQLESPKDWHKLLEHTPASLIEIATWYANFIEKYCFPGNIMRHKTDLSRFEDVLTSLKAG